MNRLSALGLALLAVGILGYVAGVATPYPGRAFSITLVMVGVTMFAIRNVLGGGSRES